MTPEIPTRALRLACRPASVGFSLLELTVSLTLIGMLVVVLLDRVLYYQELAEKSRMEYTANTLKLALQLRVGALMAEGRRIDYPAIARENPVAWLERAMPDYAGELRSGQPSHLARGRWYFDPALAELVYVVDLDRHFVAGGDASSRVRWHVQLVRPLGHAATDMTVVGARFVPAAPYRWF